MDLYGEGFKTVGKGDMHRLDLRSFFQQGFVAGESEIDDIPLILYGLIHIGLHKDLKLFQLRHSPHHIIS